MALLRCPSLWLTYTERRETVGLVELWDDPLDHQRVHLADVADVNRICEPDIFEQDPLNRLFVTTHHHSHS